jgi:hypothetical protein
VTVATLSLPHNDLTPFYEMATTAVHLTPAGAGPLSFTRFFFLIYLALFQRHQKVGTMTLSFSEPRTSPTSQSLNPMTPTGQYRLPKTGVPIPSSHIIIPCPPFLSSMASYPPCDYESGLNPAPPPLQDMPLPIQKTGMTTLKTRLTRPLANLPFDRTTNHPGSQIYPNRRTGTTTWMGTSSYPHERTTLGIHPMTMTASTRKTRPSPRVLAKAFSANALLRPPCPRSRFRWNPLGRPSLAPPPCPFFPFLPDVSPSTHIPHLPISLYAVGTRPPSLCYPQARLHKRRAAAYERNRVHLTTMSLRCLTGDKILLPYPRLLNRPRQTRGLSIFILPKHPALPDPPSCHVLGLSRSGESVRDLPAPAQAMLPRVLPRRMRHPALLRLGLDHRPALQVGFFGLRRGHLIPHQTLH